LHLTNTTYKGTTGDGIKIGVSKDDVLTKYGNPTYIQEAKQGQFLVYEFKNIIFFINNGEVENWALFRVKGEE
jgi:hypothetical protein